MNPKRRKRRKQSSTSGFQTIVYMSCIMLIDNYSSQLPLFALLHHELEFITVILMARPPTACFSLCFFMAWRLVSVRMMFRL